VTFSLSFRILVLIEDESWVLDSLVGFLRSPVWNKPTFRAEKVTFTLCLRILVLMDDESWVLDSLVGFLRGPVWNVPVLTFIEHKSLSKIS
jgi:hypothetical protein